jgi:hypothetical protein
MRYTFFNCSRLGVFAGDQGNFIRAAPPTIANAMHASHRRSQLQLRDGSPKKLNFTVSHFP